MFSIGDKYRRTGDIPDRLKNTDLYEIKLESDRWFINLVIFYSIFNISM